VKLGKFGGKVAIAIVVVECSQPLVADSCLKAGFTAMSMLMSMLSRIEFDALKDMRERLLSAECPVCVCVRLSVCVCIVSCVNVLRTGSSLSCKDISVCMASFVCVCLYRSFVAQYRLGAHSTQHTAHKLGQLLSLPTTLRIRPVGPRYSRASSTVRIEEHVVATI